MNENINIDEHQSYPDSNQKIEVPALKIIPLKKICMTIGQLPTAYLETMSYYEMLIWFINYLRDNIIPTINGNATAVQEVQNVVMQLQNYINNYKDSIDSDIEDLEEYMNNYFDNLDIQTEVNTKISEMAESGELASLLQSFQINKTHIDLSNKTNLLENASWTTTSGWVEGTNEFIHTTGSNTTLSTSVAIETGEPYILEFTCSNQYASTTEQALIVEFGGSGQFEQYKNDGTVTKCFTFYPENGELIFTPSSNWAGYITNIGLYKIEESDILDSTLHIYDENNEIAFSTIITDKDMNNISLSNNGLEMSTINSTNNIVIGNNSLAKTGSGYYNTSIGHNSQHNSINGTRNTSIGYNSLYEITNGDRNVAIGTFALHRVTTGRNNIGIGADTAWYTTTGNNNIAISNGALNGNTTGSSNIALGYFSNGGNTTGSYNISLGYLANSNNTTGMYNIGLGYFTHYKGTTDKFNVAIGHQIMAENPTNTQSEYNIGIGYQALNKSIGSNNIAIGNLALKGATTNQSNYNIALGYDVMSQAINPGTEGDNIVIGHSSGRKISGNNNIVFGRGSLNGECGNNNIALGPSSLSKTTGTSNIGLGLQSGANITSGNKNIHIGHATGSNISTASNTIIIGHDISGINEDGYITIGDKIIVRNGNIGLSTSPSTEASVTLLPGTSSLAPLKLNSGTLRTSPANGCMEFDGSHLYFTIGTTRHTII